MGKTTISPKKEEPSRWKKREESTEVPFHEKNHEFCKVKLMQFERERARIVQAKKSIR